MSSGAAHDPQGTGISGARLELRGLELSRGGRRLFTGLDLALEAGTVCTVLGPNGAGKSSLLRVAAGLAPPDAGEVWLDGRPIEAWRPRTRARRLAYLPQSTPLYHDLEVSELVMLGRAPHLGVLRGPTADDRAAVARAVQTMGLDTLSGRRVGSLSGGERQRVMLARMLAAGAEVLVLDEPTTALDIAHALDLLRRLRDLAAGGHAVLLAMHEIELARRHGDQAVCLDRHGGHDSGVTREVLTPALLERTFGVTVDLRPGLHFELGPDPMPIAGTDPRRPTERPRQG